MADNLKPLSIRSLPRVIMHIDGDAFFAACEQAQHPHLKGLALITGAERGIVAAASYEAKARGVKRGMKIHEVRQICPDIIIRPTDYETVSLYSLRMYTILQRYSPVVEQYSIDECFVDLTGLKRTFRCTYSELARKIQKEIWQELDISVSCGISLTKVLAKVASKWEKPAGVTIIQGKQIHEFLNELPVEKIWGIGPKSAAFLDKQKVVTAYDFATQEEWWVKKHFSAMQVAIWHELNGRQIFDVDVSKKESYQSIGKGRTFTPPSSNKDFVYAHLSYNMENACEKARRFNLEARYVSIYLKTQEFNGAGMGVHLNQPTAYPNEIMQVIRPAFDAIYQTGTLYRATMVGLGGLQPRALQTGLFDDTLHIEKMEKISTAIDEIQRKFGKHTIMLGSSADVKKQAQHDGERGIVTWRKNNPIPGEDVRRRLGVIVLDVKI